MIPVALTLELDCLILKSVQNDTQNVLTTPIPQSGQALRTLQPKKKI